MDVRSYQTTCSALVVQEGIHVRGTPGDLLLPMAFLLGSYRGVKAVLFQGILVSIPALKSYVNGLFTIVVYNFCVDQKPQYIALNLM
jgi:hypothetical protein